MAISINGEEAGSEMANSVIADAVESWLAAKKGEDYQRKLIKLVKKMLKRIDLQMKPIKMYHRLQKCVQTDRDMLKEIVKEEISADVKAYKLHQEYTSSPDSDEGFDDESDYDYENEF